MKHHCVRPLYGSCWKNQEPGRKGLTTTGWPGLGELSTEDLNFLMWKPTKISQLSPLLSKSSHSAPVFRGGKNKSCAGGGRDKTKDRENRSRTQVFTVHCSERQLSGEMNLHCLSSFPFCKKHIHLLAVLGPQGWDQDINRPKVPPRLRRRPWWKLPAVLDPRPADVCIPFSVYLPWHPLLQMTVIEFMVHPGSP